MKKTITLNLLAFSVIFMTACTSPAKDNRMAAMANPSSQYCVSVGGQSFSPKRMLVGTRWDIAGCLTGKWWMHGISSGRITRRVTTRLPGNFLLKNHLSLIKEQTVLLWNTA